MSDKSEGIEAMIEGLTSDLEKDGFSVVEESRPKVIDYFKSPSLLLHPNRKEYVRYEKENDHISFQVSIQKGNFKEGFNNFYLELRYACPLSVVREQFVPDINDIKECLENGNVFHNNDSLCESWSERILSPIYGIEFEKSVAAEEIKKEVRDVINYTCKFVTEKTVGFKFTKEDSP
jgi:hypothetical protein